MCNITVTTEDYKKLVEDARDGEMLKAMIRERAESYQKIDVNELRMLTQLFGGNESEEQA